MKIDYNKILNQNMINVLKEVLLNIKKNGLQDGNHLYITFNTNNTKVKIPIWLKDQYTNKMTIVIQYEYWNFKIEKYFFKIGLSFNGIKTDLEIPFDSVISFADPYANFGLQINNDINKEKNKEINRIKKSNIKKSNIKKDNIINFTNFKKN